MMKKKEPPKTDQEKPREGQNKGFDELLKAVLDIPPPEKKKRKRKGQ